MTTRRNSATGEPNPDLNELKHVDPRIAAVESLLVYHPLFKDCLSRLEEGFRLSGVTADPPCLAIVGDAGLGKTTIFEKFEALHGRTVLGDRVRIPVLTASIPPKPTVKTLAETLLYRLGDPLYMQGNATQKTNRLILLMKFCGVRSVLLDEFQHFVDKVSKNIPHEVADWLKSFIDASDAAVCVLGLPRGVEVFTLNEQLRRRFSARIILKAFGWGSDAERTAFRGFLRSIEKELKIPISRPLADPDIAYRFYCASGGNIGYVMKVIRGGVHEMVRTNAERLDLDIFAAAFAAHVWNETDFPENPFSPSFDVIREPILRLPGQPHETTSRITKARQATKLAGLLRK